MDAIARLEQDCADAWPAVVEEPLGGWRMRAAGGFTGRANSTLTVGDPGVDIATALGRTVDFAQLNGIRPATHVVVGSEAERGISDAGWTVNLDHPGGAASVVLTGPLSPEDHPDAAIHDKPPSGWWTLTAGSPEPTPAQRHVLASSPGVGYGTLTREGEIVAAVRGVIVGDLLHVARLAVRPDHRRQGLAGQLLGTLYGWAYARGARRQALQVAEHNEPALRLYAGLGCTPHHHYKYWIPAHEG